MAKDLLTLIIMYIWKSGKCLFLYFIGRNQYTCAEVFQWLETFDNKFTMNPGTVSLETTASAIQGNICICGKELLISVGKCLIKKTGQVFPEYPCLPEEAFLYCNSGKRSQFQFRFY